MKPRAVLLAAALASASLLWAEYVFFSPPGSFAVEVSLENSPYLRLPMYRNAVTSLEVVGDHAIGGTSADPGLSPFLFAVSLSQRKLDHVLDVATVISGQRAIRCGFGRGPGGVLYAGSMPDGKGANGHLFSVRLSGNGFDIADLGVPVPGEGIFALAYGPRAGALYGIASPSGKFFAFDLKTREAVVYNETAPTRREIGFLHDYALNSDDYLSRRLAVDRAGRVYGSKPVNKLFRFDPASKRIETLADELPDVWGRRPLGRVDAWAVAPDGTLYGGNAGDGQLFRLDPATGKVTNLGKPVLLPRMNGLAFGADGRLYGVAGGLPGTAHLFYYEPAGRGFVDLGNPDFTMTEAGIEQGIAWRGYQFATVASSEDGRYIVLGEDEALSQLMVFPVK